MKLAMPDVPSTEEVRYCEVLTSIVKRFTRLVGAPEALAVARRIPQLSVDDEGNVLDYNRDDPLATVAMLIEQYEELFGNVAVTLAQQATQPIAKAPTLPPTVTTPMRILLVDDHILFREGLVSLIDAQPDMKVVGGASCVQEAVELHRTLKPNLVLMDFGLPDGTGLDATKTILAESPDTTIVFLTVADDDERLFAAIRAGAMGYLFKNVRAAELLKTLRGVVHGEAGVSRASARRVLEEFSRLPPPPQIDPFENTELTPRELELVRELARGATNNEIAQRFVISENTVRNHVHNVLAKLRLHSRRDVADYARAHGLISYSPQVKH
jgi:DNA-binding NarL/FixJ family response regulator